MTETTEAEMVAKIERFGFDKPNGIIEVGAIVDCVIGSEFTPNGKGVPVALDDRLGGKVLGMDQYGNWEVCWPNGEVYTYEAALLVVRS